MAAWDGFEAALNSERLWDPATETFLAIPTGRNLFCAGQVTLDNGKLVVFGGHEQAYEGTKDTNLYDPQAGTWTPRRRHERGALVPDRHGAAGRPRVRDLGRRHHAQASRA